MDSFACRLLDCVTLEAMKRACARLQRVLKCRAWKLTTVTGVQVEEQGHELDEILMAVRQGEDLLMDPFRVADLVSLSAAPY